MTPFWTAMAFLTRLPVPDVRPDATDFAAAIRYYPAVGAVIGAIVAGSAWLGARHDAWLGALAGLVAWVMVTGALHLDGLGDVADGMGAAHGDRARLLVVMSDPHVGSFAVVAIGVQLIAKLVLLHGVAGDWRLLLVPLAARIGPLCWARWLPALGDGLGAQVATAVRWRDIAGWAAVLIGACVLAPAMAIVPLAILLFAFWLHRRLGGVNGDAHGAGIELVETGALLGLVALG